MSLWGKLQNTNLTKHTMGTSTFGVDNTFRYALSVEMSYFIWSACSGITVVKLM